MNVPIFLQGNLCINGLVVFYPCCPSNVDVQWTFDNGAENFEIISQGRILIARVVGLGGFKLRTECCRPYDGPPGGDGQFPTTGDGF